MDIREIMLLDTGRQHGPIDPDSVFWGVNSEEGLWISKFSELRQYARAIRQVERKNCILQFGEFFAITIRGQDILSDIASRLDP